MNLFFKPATNQTNEVFSSRLYTPEQKQKRTECLRKGVLAAGTPLLFKKLSIITVPRSPK